VSERMIKVHNKGSQPPKCAWEKKNSAVDVQAVEVDRYQGRAEATQAEP
jgi:hypothetical protein